MASKYLSYSDEEIVDEVNGNTILSIYGIVLPEGGFNEDKHYINMHNLCFAAMKEAYDFLISEGFDCGKIKSEYNTHKTVVKQYFYQKEESYLLRKHVEKILEFEPNIKVDYKYLEVPGITREDSKVDKELSEYRSFIQSYIFDAYKEIIEGHKDIPQAEINYIYFTFKKNSKAFKGLKDTYGNIIELEKDTPPTKYAFEISRSLKILGYAVHKYMKDGLNKDLIEELISKKVVLITKIN